jgi:hypothetical protein
LTLDWHDHAWLGASLVILGVGLGAISESSSDVAAVGLLWFGIGGILGWSIRWLGEP